MESSLSLSLATPPSEHFESLKKAARKYESQAYTKLTEYGRLAQQTVAASHHAVQQQQQHYSTAASSSSSQPYSASSSSAFSSYSDASTATSDTASLLSSSSSASAAPSSSSATSLLASLPSPAELERDIGDLLGKLAATTDDMSRSLATEGSTSGGLSETNQYTVQRYRAILHDYNSEFRKTKESITNARQRAELLLSAAPSSASTSLAASSLRPRTEQLLREKGSLQHSLRMTDELLSSAATSHSNLLQQSSSLFHTIRGKVSGLRARYPVVSSLIGRIERQRRKDVIVMGSVIAACICFTSLYIINKPA